MPDSLLLKLPRSKAHLNRANSDLKLERFRRQASYDFLSPPETDVINYEVWQWPMTAKEVCAAFATLLQDIQA